MTNPDDQPSTDNDRTDREYRQLTCTHVFGDPVTRGRVATITCTICGKQEVALP